MYRVSGSGRELILENGNSLERKNFQFIFFTRYLHVRRGLMAGVDYESANGSRNRVSCSAVAR